MRCLREVAGDRASRRARYVLRQDAEGANWPYENTVASWTLVTLAVRTRHALPGWTNWTVKRGVPHVQPPAEVLTRMITARLHLDDCAADNGALRVIPGSHAGGTLTRKDVDAVKQRDAVTICARAGDALLMKPLLLHASSPAQRPAHRRVLHIEFAPETLLLDELAWADAI